MKYNKEEMRLKVDFNNMMIRPYGFTEEFIEEYGSLRKEAFKAFKENRGKNWMGWTELPYNQDSIVKDIIEEAKKIRKNFDYFVVLGIGGSALGPIAAFNSLCHLKYNDLPKKVRKGPKFYVEDNIDPERMKALLDVIDVEKTCFNVITKSGSTSETMSQYLIINDILKEKLKERAKDNIIATTSENSGELIKIVKKEGYKVFYIPDGVGGRFSEFSPVGLLPASVLNIDIKSMLEGAKYMDKICSKTDSFYENPAMSLALQQYLAMKTGRNISVMMPYADSLKYISDWYGQLWAESLGKAIDVNSRKVNVGQTPVSALGVTSQHSLVQLFNEGPDDKVITFISVENYRNEFKIPNGCEDIANVNFLSGHTLNELIQAEFNATRYAITKHKKLNNTIILPEVNAFTFGELLMLFMIQTAYTGTMLNIDAFNQPGVEEGKKATYALLGKPGFEEKKKELDEGIKINKKYII